MQKTKENKSAYCKHSFVSNSNKQYRNTTVSISFPALCVCLFKYSITTHLKSSRQNVAFPVYCVYFTFSFAFLSLLYYLSFTYNKICSHVYTHTQTNKYLESFENKFLLFLLVLNIGLASKSHTLIHFLLRFFCFLGNIFEARRIKSYSNCDSAMVKSNDSFTTFSL